VSCFHEGPNFLVIDPDECIDCDICVPECPVDAIYPLEQVPPDQTVFIALNAELAQRWPVIDIRKDPPADAGEWAEVKGKLEYLER
jgi:ferredoxin